MALEGAFLDESEELIRNFDSFIRRVAKLEKNYILHSQEIAKLSNERSELIQNIQNLEGKNSYLQSKLSEQAEAMNILSKNNTELVNNFKASMENLIYRPSCPLTQSSDYEMIAGTCYYFETKKELSFSEAKKNCRTKFWPLSIGKLAEPLNRIINNDLWKQWEKRRLDYPFQSSFQCIIGITDKKKEGIFVYDSNKKNVTENFWHHGSPNNNNGVEDCVALLTNDGLWNDIPCEGFESHSICQAMTQDEIVESLIRTEKIEAKSDLVFCPTHLSSNYEIIEGKCYYFELTTKMAYEKANKNCFNKFGPFCVGKLAGPRNSRIDDLLYKTLKRKAPALSKTWIGINDLAREGKFVYESDHSEIWSNDYWQKKQPDNFHGSEDCVNYDDFSKKGWNDNSCSKALFSICEAFEL